jgi:hypothetical protein
VRYVLPFDPMAFVLVAGCAQGPWLGQLSARAARWPGLALIGLSLGDLYYAWPDPLAYFNATGGGQRLAYRHFCDANADWSQWSGRGLEYLRAQEAKPFAIGSKFSGPALGRLALQTIDYARPDPQDPSRARHWLDPFEPVANFGASWMVFDPRPEEWERLVERSNDARLRGDLALAYLGAGRDVDAERHLALLPAALAEPLYSLQALERAAGLADAQAAAVYAASQAWAFQGRFDRGEALLVEHWDGALAADHDRNARLLLALFAQGKRAEVFELASRIDFSAEPKSALNMARFYGTDQDYEGVLSVLPGAIDGLQGLLREEALTLLERAQRFHDLLEPALVLLR